MIEWIGAAATAAAGISPPLEVTITTGALSPASRSELSSSARCVAIIGFSDASIAAADARRYSRIVGFS